MWFVRIRKERRAFYDAAEVVRRTARIESKLEMLGGTGSGIYDKYKVLEQFFPEEMETKIIELGTMRNRVVHGNPKIENPKAVFKLCKEVEKMIDAYPQSNKKKLRVFSLLLVLVLLSVIAIGVWEIAGHA